MLYSANNREMKEQRWFLFQMKGWQQDQTWQQVSETGPVMFPDAIEYHSPGRHVHSHCKCLSGKKHLTQRKRHKAMFYLSSNKGLQPKEWRYCFESMFGSWLTLPHLSKQRLFSSFVRLTFTRPREKSISVTSFSIGRIPL